MNIMVLILAVIAILGLGFFLFAGYVAYFGPFRGLAVQRIRLMYRRRPKGEIVFYGASNFTLWRMMEADMAPFAVQNHGFGGSADIDLIARAGQLLFPYQPAMVVFQSGSNDFNKGLTVADVCANKERMYQSFRRQLPDAPFIVCAMLPLPGRSGHWPDSMRVNAFLRNYCLNHERMFYVDATDTLMTAQGAFRPELFRRDNIHLNRDGQLLWGALIKKTLEEGYNMTSAMI